MNTAPIRVYWYAPPVVMAARVNMPGGITYPIQDITYDGVTTGAFGDCRADMFFTLGSAEGLDDYGRGRLRATPTSTILKVGRSSQGYEDGQLSVVDSAWIHVFPDYRVHAKIPTIQNFIEFKDTDIAVGDLTTAMPPIVNMGSDFAQRIDAISETIIAIFDGVNSIAVADGATIVTYAWEAPGGTFVNGTDASDAAVQIEFPVGVYVVQLTVTDSNGVSNSGHRLVLADDPNDSLCVSGMQLQNLTWDQKTRSARLRLLQDLPRADYADGAHLLIWEDRDPAIYGTPDPASRAHLLFSGWHQTDQASVRSLETHRQRDTILTCVDVAGRLDSLPGFPQRVEVPTEDDLVDPGMNWGYMPAANMDKFMAYLLHWHSTAGAVADFYPSGTWDEYPFVIFDSGGATLFEQLARQAARIVPDYTFGADRFGALRVEAHPWLQNVADRPVLAGSITENSWSEIDFGYQRSPRVHTLRGSALLTQTAWIIDPDADEGDEKQLLTPVFCIAPGTAPGQGGREQTLGERLAKSQADLNDCVGHHYAKLNARYGPITLTPTLNIDPWAIDPARMALITLFTSTATAPQRGLDFEQIRTLPTEVSIDYSYSEEATTWRARVTLEPETIGLPALTEVQEPALPVGEQPTEFVPPDFGLTPQQESIVGIGADGFRYLTDDFQTPSGSGGPTWTRVDLGIAATIYSWVVDPFSPGYLAGSGAIDGWIVNDTDIYRVEDLFGTPSVASELTFAVATDSAQGHWRTIQASFGAFFGAGVNPWLLCVSYYGDTPGHTGTWSARSVDGGATWSAEVQVSAHYDPGPLQRTLPIAVYTSPKTPGWALTCAYIETGSPALGDGYVSLDWGETWNRVSGEVEDDAIEQLPRWRVWDNDSSLYQAGSTLSGKISIEASVAMGPSSSASENFSLVCGAPINANRLTMRGRWTSYLEDMEATVLVGIDPDVSSGIGQSEDLTHVVTEGVQTWEDFNLEWTFTGANWPNSRDAIMAAVTKFGASFDCRATASTSGDPDALAVAEASVILRVDEIELDGGLIYVPPIIGPGWLQPGEGFGGSLHLPWLDNDAEEIGYYGHIERLGAIAYSLIESIAGVQSDISPTDSGVSYGPAHGSFGVRCFDADRQLMALGGIGNDAGTDKVGLWVSANAGASWGNILAPVAATEAVYGLQIAFGAQDSDVLYAWGGKSDGSIAAIYFSSDFGVGLDDRSGNLESSFGGVAFIGIAGGPSA